MKSDHDEDAHYKMAPSDVAAHLAHDHEVTDAGVLALLDSVSDAELVEYRSRTDPGPLLEDLLAVLHEQMHAGTTTLVRYADELFGGTAVGGVPMPEHPVWKALGDQALDDAHTVDLEQETDVETVAEWLDGRLRELIAETDLNAELIEEQLQTLAEALALELSS